MSGEKRSRSIGSDWGKAVLVSRSVSSLINWGSKVERFLLINVSRHGRKFVLIQIVIFENVLLFKSDFFFRKGTSEFHKIKARRLNANMLRKIQISKIFFHRTFSNYRMHILFPTRIRKIVFLISKLNYSFATSELCAPSVSLIKRVAKLVVSKYQ